MNKSGSRIPLFLSIFVGLITVLAACAPGMSPYTEPGGVTSLPGVAPNYGVAPSQGSSQPGIASPETKNTEELTGEITVQEMAPGDAIVLQIVPPEGFMGEVTVPEAVSVIPGIQLVSTDIMNGDLVVEARVSGFILDPEAIGMAKVEGTGHWHLYIDGKLAGFSANNSITISSDKLAEFGSGIHEIKIELHNNDHSMVSETAWAGTKIDFSASMMAPDVSRDYMIDGYNY